MASCHPLEQMCAPFVGFSHPTDPAFSRLHSPLMVTVPFPLTVHTGILFSIHFKTYLLIKKKHQLSLYVQDTLVEIGYIKINKILYLPPNLFIVWFVGWKKSLCKIMQSRIWCVRNLEIAINVKSWGRIVDWGSWGKIHKGSKNCVIPPIRWLVGCEREREVGGGRKEKDRREGERLSVHPLEG